jgi:uncharacterized protein involved in exopolysaccharide biosynthesis
MTDDELQRKMEFIVEQQAQFAASQQQLEELLKRAEERRIRDQPRIAELRKSFKDLVELATITDERMDNGEFRVTALETRSTALETSSAALEASMAHLAVAQAHADERVSALIDIIIEGRNGPS